MRPVSIALPASAMDQSRAELRGALRHLGARLSRPSSLSLQGRGSACRFYRDTVSAAPRAGKSAIALRSIYRTD